VSFATITPTNVNCCKRIFRYRLSPEIFGYTVVYTVLLSYMSPCHNGMASPRDADRIDGLQIWRAAANILNK
jgi:hypothetical protein